MHGATNSVCSLKCVSRNWVDDGELDVLFDKYVATLPEGERPQSGIQRSQQHVAWHQDFERELAVWKDELAELENRAVDKQAIFSSASNKVVYLLRRAAEAAELLPDLQVINQQSGQNVVGVASKSADGIPKRFYIVSKQNGISAECDVYSKDRIIVLAGSTATKRELNPNHRGYIKRKNELIADGVLVDDGQMYKFTEDCEFQGTPSAATPVAAIILGNTGATDGKGSLKDDDGKTFRDHFG